MIDASLGAKCAINFRTDKNLLGAFALPLLVILDPTFCATQSPTGIRAAMPELGKAAMIVRKRDERLLLDLEQHGRHLIDTRFQGDLGMRIIRAGAGAMLRSISPDVYEADYEHRAADYAHTLQRGVEQHALQCEQPFPHGFAVGICAIWSNEIALARGIIQPDTCERYWHMLNDWDVPVWHPSLADPGTLTFALERNDRHRNGSVVLPSDENDAGVIFTRVTGLEGMRAIERLAERAGI